MINLIKSLMWMGLIYSIYGIIALEFGDRILWYEKTSYQGYLTSVFINRNHFAFYGCISLLSSFYMFIKQLSDSDIKLSFINIIEFISSKGLIPIISILIIITAIFKTGSRGSIVLLITGFSTMFFLWFYKAKNYISKKQKYYCWFLFIVFITLLLFSINETISKRFHYLGNSLDERIAVWKICWKIFIQNPLFGYGAGEFENMFNSVRDLTISPFKRWDKAHNDYLEIIIEYGIFYGAIFWGFILWMIFHIFKSLNFPSRLFGRNILFIAVIAMLFVHSLFDFGGQMPAIAFIIITLTTSAFIRSV